MRAFLMTAVALGVLSAFAGNPQPARAAPGDAPVVITMTVPANAEVWFDGTKTVQTGENRRFFSPPITAGRKYSYEVRVVAGKMDLTRPLTVRAGDRINLDFTGAQVRESREGPGTAAAYYDPDAPGSAASVPLALPAQPLRILPFESQTNPSFDSYPPQG
jgi:uncharacterized protein (TIGR03000 family)